MRPKRLISLLVAVCMMVAMLPFSAVPAFAADAGSFTVGGVRYSINGDNKSVTIVGYDEATLPEDLDIPNTVSYGNAEYSVVGFTKSTPGAFYNCNKLKSVKIPDSIETMGQQTFLCCSNLFDVTFKGQSHFKYIGYQVFGRCTSLESIVIPSSVIGFGKGTFSSSTALKNVVFTGDFQIITQGAFNNCESLESITLPASVTQIRADAFKGCTKLEEITIPSSVKEIGDNAFANSGLKKIKYTGTQEQWSELVSNSSGTGNDKLTGEAVKHEYAHTVTFNNGEAANEQTVVVPYAETVTAPDAKVKGYRIVGYYANAAYTTEFDFTKKITEDTTVYVKWEPIPDHELTVKVGTFTYDDNAASDKGNVYEGALVTVTFDENNQLWKDSGLSFDHWDIQSKAKLLDENGEEIVNPGKTFTFVMPKEGVTIEAMPKDATIEEEEEPNVLGTAAIIGTAAVGTAVLGYQAYSLGTEFAGKLMALPYFPSNRSALAMMLWEDAGKPMPESELLYPDVEQEERDMDLQHAARWAMENELIPDLNDEGTAPEEMKFFPANPVSKLDVLNAWQKAQELKNN